MTFALRHLVGLTRLVLLGALAVFLLSGGTGSGSRAEAVGGAAGPIQVTVDRTVDGTGVTARAEAPAGVLIYEIAAHYCIPNANIRNTFDFGFQGRKCTNAPVGASDVEQKVEYPDGVSVAELPYFRFDAGTTRWVNSRGYDQEIACGPGQPCDVVLQLQITNGTVYLPAPVCFDAACPAGTIGETPVAAPPPAPETPVEPAIPEDAAGAAAGMGRTGAAAEGQGAAGAGGPEAVGSKAADGNTGSSSSGDPTEQASSTGISLTTVSSGPSQATRVRAAAVAGMAGGVLIFAVVSRGRRRMEEESW